MPFRPPVVPTATYRLQLSGSFGFDDAARIVPYLAELGISHVYASPFLKARAGSQHGYDVVDHGELNPEFGGILGFERLSAALKKAGLGLILDFVPNHMAVGGADNAWWLDVLEWGPQSPHAASFDFDWAGLSFQRRPGILLPILSEPYGRALADGHIALRFDAQEGSFSAWYYEHRLPIAPRCYPAILKRIVADANPGDQLADLVRTSDGASLTRADATELKRALADLSGAADTITQGLEAFRPSPDAPERERVLHNVLEQQHYRLAHWRMAVSDINYRRFFDINDLAGIRVEDPATFAATHRLVARLAARNELHGLRLDHIDGLYDPQQYCAALQRLFSSITPDVEPQPIYVVVEKILADGEVMPDLPGVAGTTGYEWLNLISRLLVDAEGLAALRRLLPIVTASRSSFDRILKDSKRTVLDTMMASEFTALVHLLARIAAGNRRSRDYSFDRLRAVLRQMIIHFPVYRTYVSDEEASAEDRSIIDHAMAAASGREPRPDGEIYDFIRNILTLDFITPGRSGYSKARVRRFAGKFQQLTGPVMAKALEDTAFYRYPMLLALNEVGGDPRLPALSINEFHQRLAVRAKKSPHGMTATATHDTKRGEDARARLLALSEFAGDWAAEIDVWRGMNRRFIEHLAGAAPSPAHEYLLYQALLGAWPLSGPDAEFVERMQAYAIKAAREGKRETSWLDPDAAYEAALERYVAAVLDRHRSSAFIDQFSAFATRVARLGALNSLSQLALKASMPGVPDFYQGTESWDLSLVDPDNRRPVDFTGRAAALAQIGPVPDWQALAGSWPDGRVKLALTRHLLGLRRDLPRLFRDGSYRPLEVIGPGRDHVLAFARSLEGTSVIVAVGRRFGRLTEGGRLWPAAAVWNASLVLEEFGPASDSLMPGRTPIADIVPVADLFDPLPVAILQTEARQTDRIGGRPVAACSASTN